MTAAAAASDAANKHQLHTTDRQHHSQQIECILVIYHYILRRLATWSPKSLCQLCVYSLKMTSTLVDVILNSYISTVSIFSTSRINVTVMKKAKDKI